MVPSKILLGVSGGIAAYKAADLVRAWVKEGAEVQVILTRRAEEFVTPLTLTTLSSRPVARDEFADTLGPEIGHIELAKWADALVIAPATANVLARLARGLADDLLSTTAIAFDGPLVIAPAMNPKMWDHAETRANVAALEADGAVIVPPDEGFVACGDEGPGRLAALETIVVEGIAAAVRSTALGGQRVVVTAGPTIEPLDPVRFVGNRSSGKMGYAIARAARARGAQVTLVSGPTCLPPPWGVDVLRVETAREMREAVFQAASEASMVVMAAAVADHRPLARSEKKLNPDKSARYSIEMEPNPDILAELCAARAEGRLGAETVIVGFAAETGEAAAKGAEKRRRKGCDLIVANDVAAPGSEFGSETNAVTIIDDAGHQALEKMSKRQVAERLLDAVAARRSAR